MRVFYSHYLTDACHPAVEMVDSISRELRSVGHQVYVHASAGLSSPIPGREQQSHKVSSDSFVATAKRYLWFAKAIARNRRWYPSDYEAIRQFAPDIVLCRQDAYCWSVAKAAKNANVPIVTYADAPVAYETRMFNFERRWHPPLIVERIERWGLQASEAIVTVSHPAARRLRRYGLPVPILVNHNGIDTDRFPDYSAEQRVEIKRSLGLADNVVLGFQGTFKPFHGIDRLRELMLWSAKHPEVTWLLIGDGPERAALEQAVEGKVNAVFLGRRKSEEMGRLLSAIDIAVAPHSKLTGDFYFCPLKILEYAASGCATIASEQGDIPLLLSNGLAGEIVKDDELKSWTTALEKLISDHGYRKAISKHAREHTIENLTWRKTARRAERVLSDVLGIQPLMVQEPETQHRKCDRRMAYQTA